jgi:hypothetical protein
MKSTSPQLFVTSRPSGTQLSALAIQVAMRGAASGIWEPGVVNRPALGNRDSSSSNIGLLGYVSVGSLRALPEA